MKKTILIALLVLILLVACAVSSDESFAKSDSSYTVVEYFRPDGRIIGYRVSDDGFECFFGIGEGNGVSCIDARLGK